MLFSGTAFGSLELKPLARLVDYSLAGVDPTMMHGNWPGLWHSESIEKEQHESGRY